nr:T9SS type A sorting domain-containing protein [Ignavibacteria bacterium]
SFYTTDSLRLDDLCFTDSLSGWAVGNFGTILKYIYNSTGIVEISSLNIPDNFTLFQNYPNPFNPNTKIKFELKNNSTVSLKIYDILGNEIADLINDDIKNELTAGTYEVDFSGNGLPSGVYFYELVVSSPREEGSPNSLNTPNYSQVKKMLLLK